MSLFFKIIINVAIFIIVRYVTLILAFLSGMGSSDYYKYEGFIYLPSVAIHLIILLYLFYKSFKFEHKILEYFWVLILIIFLSISGYFGIIPYSIIPY